MHPNLCALSILKEDIECFEQTCAKMGLPIKKLHNSPSGLGVVYEITYTSPSSLYMLGKKVESNIMTHA